MRNLHVQWNFKMGLVSLLLLPILCIGLVFGNKDPSWFVVNGRDAAPHAWPHQGAIKRSSGGSHVCGCLHLNEQYALTAAHCVDPPVAENYYVLFGTNTMNGDDGEPETRTLTNIVPHEDFTNTCETDGECYNHDIALLEFTEQLEENPGFIEKIPLSANQDRYDQECFLTGWGQLFGGGSSPDWLQEAPFNVITADECRERLGGSATYWNPQYQVCCYDNTDTNPDGPSGPCFGDSGGPVQCRASPNDPWELVGLANWMIGDCESAYPSAWTNITYYRDWICSNTGDNSLCP